MQCCQGWHNMYITTRPPAAMLVQQTVGVANAAAEARATQIERLRRLPCTGTWYAQVRGVR